MQETIQEFVDSRGQAMQVDRARGVIHGVKILGLTSRNGRIYRPEALAGAVGLYEGAKVNVNHSKGGALGPRDYQDRIGAIRNVAARADAGLFADFHFNPKHALAEQLLWDAEHAPENVGFSHNVQAQTSRQGDSIVVEAIVAVESVDLVADPATTRGLFESVASDESTASRPGAPPPGGADAVSSLTDAELRAKRPDLVASLLEAHDATIARLREEIDRLRAAESAAARRALVRRLLRENGLPDPDDATGLAVALVSAPFIESVLAAPTEDAMRRLVEDRAALSRSGGWSESARATAPTPARTTPMARDGIAPAADRDTRVESFVAAIARPRR